MKEFLQILKRFVPPYKKFLTLSIVFNILSAILNIFSFAALIPILQILFQVDGGIRANDLMTWDGTWSTAKEVATNNLYFYIQNFIIEYSASTALLVIGLFLAFRSGHRSGRWKPPETAEPTRGRGSAWHTGCRQTAASPCRWRAGCRTGSARACSFPG